VAPVVEREIAQQMRQGQVFVRGGHRALLLGERQGDGPDLLPDEPKPAILELRRQSECWPSLEDTMAVALVTGASSGIGLATAVTFGSRRSRGNRNDAEPECSRRAPEDGAEGIRTSDLRSAGTRALHSAAASGSAGLTVEGAPLDPALDRRCFKSPVEVRASVHRRSSPRPSSFQIQVKS
jgi:hypothetical protein